MCFGCAPYPRLAASGAGHAHAFETTRGLGGKRCALGFPSTAFSVVIVQSESATMSVDRRLQAIFEAVFGPEVSQLSAQDSPATIRSWDSLNHVHLILALEAEFGVQFDTDEIANLISVGAIQRRLTGGSSASGQGASGISPARAAS